MTSTRDKRETFRHATDARLLEGVLTGDELAWRELLRRFRGLMYSCISKVIYRYESVVSSEAVNEIFSDVCLHLLHNDMKKLRSYDPERGSKLGSWIGLISIHATYDHLRVIARQPILDRLDGALEHEDSTPSPYEYLLEKERWRAVQHLSRHFTPTDRRFIELYYALGLPPEQIANKMRISIKTVYSKKHKIRTRLMELARMQQAEPMAA